MSLNYDPSQLQQIEQTEVVISPSSEEAKAILYYDIYDPLLFDFRDEVEQALKPSIHTETRRYMLGASPMFPMLELVFLFATTTIATSILGKLGEDVYNVIKKKLAKTFSKKEDQAQLMIWIATEEYITGGHLLFKDYETAIEAIREMPSILALTEEAKNKLPKEITTTTSITPFKEKFITTKSGLIFSYKYDDKSKKWILAGIDKARPL